MASVKTPVQVEGRHLMLSNLTKPLWPEDGITKGELIDYYTRMAPVMLPYLRGRPLVMTRYPDGIHGKWFYHKDAPPGVPEWIPTWGDEVRYLIPEEPAALTYMANLGAIELHPWLSSAAAPDNPDWAVIDLDPSEGSTFEDVLILARLVRQLLTALNLQGFPKLSGATGIHIFCPCARDHTYGDTAAFCEWVGRILLYLQPNRVTLERVVSQRTGKVYVDFLQNRKGQTITAVYGLRPLPGAPVSAPVTWQELESEPPRFTIRTIWRRLEQVGDLFASMPGQAQDLKRATASLQSMLI